MKGSCNYREAYLPTAEVSEEWHKLGQKPEVIRFALCVLQRERGNERARPSEKMGDREISDDFSSSESTSELYFSLLALRLSFHSSSWMWLVQVRPSACGLFAREESQNFLHSKIHLCKHSKISNDRDFTACSVTR